MTLLVNQIFIVVGTQGWSDTPTHTVARVCYLENNETFSSNDLPERGLELLSLHVQSHVNAFYIALVLLHEYFTQKA